MGQSQRIKNAVGNQAVKEFLAGEFGGISRVTVGRDLDNLLKNNLIVKKGKGRSVLYEENIQSEIIDEFSILGDDLLPFSILTNHYPRNNMRDNPAPLSI